MDGILEGKIGMLPSRLWHIVLFPDEGGLWFLWITFLCCLFFYLLRVIERMIIKKIIDSRYHTLICLIVDYLVYYVFKVLIFERYKSVSRTGTLEWGLTFFLVVYWIHRLYDLSEDSVLARAVSYFESSIWIKIMFVMLFAMMGLCFDRTLPTGFIYFDQTMGFIEEHINIFVVNKAVAFVLHRYKIVVAYSGVMALLSFSYFLKRTYIDKISIVGLFTVHIYAIHRYLINSYFGIMWVDLLISLVLGITLPIFIGFFCNKRCHLLSKVLFGGR